MKERILKTLDNAEVLRDAAWGAATKRNVLSSSLVGKYLETIKGEPLPSFNPDEKIIKQELLLKITKAINGNKNGQSLRTLFVLPWNSQEIEISRLTAALIAYSDDHGRKTVPEFFPVDEISQFLEVVRSQYLETGKQLTVPDQFNIALCQVDNNPIAATLLVHGSYRAMRSSDTRISPRLFFEVDSDTQSITMMSIARSTADFSIADTRDPLGNTYHWWAQFSAGMLFSILREKAPLQMSIFTKAFYFGPDLTQSIRGKILRIPSKAGYHKDVDRQGLRVGRAMGSLIKKLYSEN